jgi:hypothetical protein
VILTWDPDRTTELWLMREYLPEAEQYDRALVSLAGVREVIGDCRVEPVLVPHDCTDGFFASYWRRPWMYLDPGARAAISGLALIPEAPVERMTIALRDDLASGAWERRHADLLELPAFDAGYRLVIG